jgi:Ser/Thr protein kinase RdoA (MazF antagonist)
LEFIDGEKVCERPEDEFELGVLASRFHAVEGYPLESNLRFKERIRNMMGRFKDKPFYSSYVRYIHNLPDFDSHKQCLIHTDIGPHNAIKRSNGQFYFIDLDDAGIGSKYIDLGYPLICQFVRFHNGQLKFDQRNASAFYQGYQLNHQLNEAEVELTFQGAVFMQMMYMNAFGADAIEPMWTILEFGLNNKEILKSAIRGRQE